MRARDAESNRDGLAQSGQALTESLLAVTALISFILCLTEINRIQTLIFQSQSTSHYQAFSMTKMRPPPTLLAPAHVDSKGYTNISTKMSMIDRGGSTGTGTFEDVIATSTAATQLLTLVINKTSYTIRSDSHASSERHMHQRLEKDQKIWGKVSSQAQQDFQKFAQQLGTLDTPWMRAQPSSDWLDRWGQVVPLIARQIGR